MSTDLYGVPFTLIHAIGTNKRTVVDLVRSVSDEEGLLEPARLAPEWDQELREHGCCLEDHSFDFYEHFERKQSLFIEGAQSCSLLSSVLEDSDWTRRRLHAAVWRFSAIPPDLKSISMKYPNLTFLVTWCDPTEDIAEAGFDEWHNGVELQAGHLTIDAGRHLFMQFARIATGWNFPVHYGQG